MELTRNLYSLFLLQLFIFISSGFSQEQDSLVQEVVNKYAASGDINGAVLIAEDGKEIFSAAFGTANYEWKLPNKVDTKFRIYSMSKQFTAMLVMQLVQAGKIDLQKTISDYLPYYRIDTGNKISIHQLLTHTHGIAEGYDKLPPFLITNQTKDLIRMYFSNKLDFEPGSEFRYSGLLGYTILAALIEEVTGRPYKEVLQEKILSPLGMSNSVYLDYRRLITNKASDYTRNGQEIEHRIQAYHVNAQGASCLVSTVRDLLLWDQALYSDELLVEEYKNLIFTLHVKQHAPYYYGYGWYLADVEIGGETKRIQYHTGGGTSIIFRSVSDKHTVIMLNNFRSNKLYAIGIEILEAMQVK